MQPPPGRGPGGGEDTRRTRNPAPTSGHVASHPSAPAAVTLPAGLGPSTVDVPLSRPGAGSRGSRRRWGRFLPRPLSFLGHPPCRLSPAFPKPSRAAVRFRSEAFPSLPQGPRGRDRGKYQPDVARGPPRSAGRGPTHELVRRSRPSPQPARAQGVHLTRESLCPCNPVS